MSFLERYYSASRDLTHSLETDYLLNDLDSTDFARVTVDCEWSSDAFSLTPHLTDPGF